MMYFILTTFHLKFNYWFHDSFAQYAKYNESYIPTLFSLPGWTPTLVCCFNKPKLVLLVHLLFSVLKVFELLWTLTF